ncbi:DUF1622 domain-containing protein [Rhizobium sp. SIMBA_035]
MGLEILIGADIIAIIISPLTWESVGPLGLIVLIRTLLSFSLNRLRKKALAASVPP